MLLPNLSLYKFPFKCKTFIFSYTAFLAIPPKTIFHAVTSNPPG
jgi:hypothetical protein